MNASAPPPKTIPLNISTIIAAIGLLLAITSSLGTLFYKAGVANSKLEQIQITKMDYDADVKELKKLVGLVDKRSAENQLILNYIKENLNEINARIRAMDQKFTTLYSNSN